MHAVGLLRRDLLQMKSTYSDPGRRMPGRQGGSRVHSHRRHKQKLQPVNFSHPQTQNNPHWFFSRYPSKAFSSLSNFSLTINVILTYYFNCWNFRLVLFSYKNRYQHLETVSAFDNARPYHIISMTSHSLVLPLSLVPSNSNFNSNSSSGFLFVLYCIVLYCTLGTKGRQIQDLNYHKTWQDKPKTREDKTR